MDEVVPLGERIVASARAMVGTPWFHAGRQPGLALDCIGLLACVAHELGITDFDDVNYSAEGSPEYLTEVLERFGRCVYRDDPPEEQQLFLMPGDLLQFFTVGAARHCGIYARAEDRSETIIHAYQSAGKVLEHPFDIHWRRRLYAAYRLPG